MTRKPAEVVRAIKAKVATVKATRAKPVESPSPTPQAGEWRCLVCGNAANGDTCPVDGSQGKP